MAQDNAGVDIECIIVDDSGVDNSMDIVRQMVDDYHGSICFELLKHDVNRGLSAARNTGLCYATGEYVLFVDADDYIIENGLIKLLRAVERFPEVEVVKGNHVGREKMNVSHVPTKIIDNDKLLELFYMCDIPAMVWNTLIKRSIIEKWRMTFRTGIVYEDNLWSYHLYRHVKSFLFVNEETYCYTDENEDSITANKEIANQIEYFSHFIIIVEEQLSTFDIKHEVSFTLYVEMWLLQMLDKISKNKVKESMRTKVLHLRNQLTLKSLCHFRFILVAFELLMFWPLVRLTRIRWFRHNFYKIMKATNKIAMCSPLNLILR